MLWEPLREKLEQILNADVLLETVRAEEWNKDADSRDIADRVHFRLRQTDEVVETMSIESGLSSSERQLIELMIRTFRDHIVADHHEVSEDADSLQKMTLLRSWIFKQLERGQTEEELPDTLHSFSSLFTVRVPLLLYGESADSGSTNDLSKLLETFFDAEIVLIPLLQKEWLILAPESVISASAVGSGEEETIEESLESISRGLHDMLVGEWIGECHLAADYPIIPAKELVGAIVRLKETITLGRQYRMGVHIHLPWQMHLEKLLNLLPEAEKKGFAERILKRMDYAMDSETLQTLEQFFELDCNVSETAKMLYIHRNTLLYRLDKFKQETGLDVRTFSHAVLVKIALVLYKVTKRK